MYSYKIQNERNKKYIHRRFVELLEIQIKILLSNKQIWVLKKFCRVLVQKKSIKFSFCSSKWLVNLFVGHALFHFFHIWKILFLLSLLLNSFIFLQFFPFVFCKLFLKIFLLTLIMKKKIYKIVHSVCETFKWYNFFLLLMVHRYIVLLRSRNKKRKHLNILLSLEIVCVFL